VDSFAQQISGIRYTVPWSTLGVIVGLAYFASLLTTFLPASQASRVYPAEALRYE
jgi:putative ABC transport system permease protein